MPVENTKIQQTIFLDTSHKTVRRVQEWRIEPIVLKWVHIMENVLVR